MESKIKHLEFLQAVINRMAGHSFAFKGWAVAVLTGLSAYAARSSDKRLILVGVVATLVFWLVDSFYLSIERGYRNLYEKTAKVQPAKINFSMKLNSKNKNKEWLKALYSRVLIVFYGSLLLINVLAIILIRR